MTKHDGSDSNRSPDAPGPGAGSRPAAPQRSEEPEREAPPAPPRTPGGATDLFDDWDDLDDELEHPAHLAGAASPPPWAAPYPPGVFPGMAPQPPPHASAPGGAGTASNDEGGFVEPALTGGPQEVLEAVVEALKTIYDPEIPVNIYDLGLIYGVHLDDEGVCTVKMTLTAPGCPAAVILPEEVRYRAGLVDGVRDAKVDIVWDPPWTPARMSESARLELGFF